MECNGVPFSKVKSPQGDPSGGAKAPSSYSYSYHFSRNKVVLGTMTSESARFQIIPLKLRYLPGLDWKVQRLSYIPMTDIKDARRDIIVQSHPRRKTLPPSKTVLMIHSLQSWGGERLPPDSCHVCQSLSATTSVSWHSAEAPDGAISQSSRAGALHHRPDVKVKPGWYTVNRFLVDN